MDLFRVKELALTREVWVIYCDCLGRLISLFFLPEFFVICSAGWCEEERRLFVLESAMLAMDSSPDIEGTGQGRVRRLERELKELRRKLRDQKRVVLRLDEEGGRQFELVEEDLLQMREDLSDSIDQKLRPQLDTQAELESRILKLEMQVGRLTLDKQIEKEEMQASPFQSPGASSNFECQLAKVSGFCVVV